MRYFERFPQNKKCIICGTSEDKECFLVPIDGTDEGNKYEVTPVHRDCLAESADSFRYNKGNGIIYKFI